MQSGLLPVCGPCWFSLWCPYIFANIAKHEICCTSDHRPFIGLNFEARFRILHP